MSEESRGREPPGAARIAAILLAAGSSSRMGAHKLLLPLNDRPLLAWGLAAVCASSARPIILALGRAAEEVVAALPEGPYTTVVNADYAQGMGTTLALAVSRLPSDVAGALILLGDQPFMTTAAIEDVLAVARRQPERIAQGAHSQRRGHPVYLPRRTFAQLQSLRADEGARAIVAREGDAVMLVDIADEHAQFDVDTLDDYRQAQTIAHFAGNLSP